MMMTAYSAEDLVAEALEEGAYKIIYKPIEIEKVVELIEHVKEGALILIVDVDLSTCKALVDFLKKKGYRVAKARSGEEAIKKAQERNFDTVFIEVKMPVMNGLETFLSLRKIRPDIKVIMTTSYRQGLEDLIDEAIRKNAYTCICKPFDVEKVVKLLEGALAGKTKAEIQQMVD
jgi:DNA-binding NtrC family response regulator